MPSPQIHTGQNCAGQCQPNQNNLAVTSSPPPALATSTFSLTAQTQLQQLLSKNLLCLGGKLRQACDTTCLQPQRASSGAHVLSWLPSLEHWAALSMTPCIPEGRQLSASLSAWLRSRATPASRGKHLTQHLLWEAPASAALKSALGFPGRDPSRGARIFLLLGTHHPLAHSHC